MYMIPRGRPFRFMEIFAFPNLFAVISLYILLTGSCWHFHRKDTNKGLTVTYTHSQMQLPKHLDKRILSSSVKTTRFSHPPYPTFKNCANIRGKAPWLITFKFEFLCSQGRLSFFLCPVRRYHSPLTQGSPSINSGHRKKTRKTVQHKIHSKIPPQY